MSEQVRTRLAGLLVIGALTWSPLEIPVFSAEPPPARVLPIGEPMRRLESRRLESRRLDPWNPTPWLRSSFS